jgi:hypothetical protein
MTKEVDFQFLLISKYDHCFITKQKYDINTAIANERTYFFFLPFSQSLGVGATCLLPPFSSITRHFITHSRLSNILPYTVNPYFFRSTSSSSTFHIHVHHSSSHMIFLSHHHNVMSCRYQLKRFPFSFSVIGATLRLPAGIDMSCRYQLKRSPFSFSVIGATLRLPLSRSPSANNLRMLVASAIQITCVEVTNTFS